MTGPMELRLDREHFLAQHWQREPLLVRGALPSFNVPVSAEELAGLALEDEVESRLIEYREQQWQLHHGPFSEADFRREHPWTLLVQAVDHYVPEVAALRRMADFIPQWRVDDVMVSYAVDGGSVGPHYDNYDVFLLQGEGRRLWHVGQQCNADSPMQPHDELRILENFETTAEYLLEPGDMLYLPPGLAHWGIAQGECTTFSIGFRAPRINDLISRFADGALAELSPELFYGDAGRAVVSRPGEISAEDITRAREQLLEALQSSRDNRWLGELVTEPRYEIAPDDDELAESRALLREPGESVSLAPEARLAWQLSDGELCVFANGDSRSFPAELAAVMASLCGNWELRPEELAVTIGETQGAALLDYLLETGCIYVQ